MSDDLTNDKLLGFELSQIAASIGELIHRADALRGDAPSVPFRSLDLPIRRRYLTLGERAISHRPLRDEAIGVDQHRDQARRALRAIQGGRAAHAIRRAITLEEGRHGA